MSVTNVLSAFISTLCAFSKLRSVLLLSRSLVGERKGPLLGVCFFFFFPFRHSREECFFRTLYLFQVKNWIKPFVCEKAWRASCVGLFLGVCLFSVQLISERTFALALCGWLKRQKRSPGLYPRRLITDCKSGSLLKRLHVLPIPKVISFFFHSVIAVKTSSLQLCIYYKPKSKHIVCTSDSLISELRNFIGSCLFSCLFLCNSWCAYDDAVCVNPKLMIKGAVLQHP